MKDYIQLGENYRLTSDGKQNLILHEKYEKTEGRGKNAVPTGEFDFRWLGYFRRLEYVGEFLVEQETYKNLSSGLEQTVIEIEKLRDDIVEAMNKVEVTWIE